MAQGQFHLNANEKFTKAIQKYKIILDEVDALDSFYESDHTKNLFYAMFEFCLPNLEKELQSLKILDRDHKELVKNLNLLKKPEITKDIPADAKMRHESPIVHLLCLALERSAVSYSREVRLQGENWGRFGSFPNYLKKLKLKDWDDENDVQYWPGVPTCVMTYVPIWAPQIEYQVSISASPDRFAYAHETRKNLWKRRGRRLNQLREQCDKSIIALIDAVKLFPKELGIESNWDKLFNSNGLDPHSWRPHDLKPHDSVPVYLPIIVSTWKPNGHYLRACLRA